MNRFEEILNKWQWFEDGGAWDDEQDAWRPVRHCQEKFNKRAQEVCVPGFILCVDESTIRWYGLEEWHTNGCPHVTKIPRKPENISVETRVISDGQWDIALGMEIQEGAVQMEKKKYVQPGRNAGTAYVMRAVEPWQGSQRVVVGDSAFASVQTAVALSQMGLFFTGIVKNASKNFPKKKMKSIEMTYRGETKAASAVQNGVELMAVVWNEPGKKGKARKMLVSSWGTTLPAHPLCRKRYQKNMDTGLMDEYYKEIPIAQVSKDFFASAGSVDRFNRVRQDGIRMERNVEVKVWHKRVLISFLGFVGANAYKGYLGEGGTEGQSEFFEGLALEMMLNVFDGCKRDGITSSRKTPEKMAQFFVDNAVPQAGQVRPALAGEVPQVLRHIIRPLSVLAQYKGNKNAKLHCKICGDANARYFCVSCSNLEHRNYIALCGCKGENDCQAWHFQLA